MTRPRMWMQVGVWPPPAVAHWRPSRHVQVQRRRWVVAGLVVSLALGAAVGSVATLALVAAVGTVGP